MSSKQAAEWSTILIFGHPVDKKKVPARLVIAVTVLFLIISGLPVSDVYENIASADSNPYVPGAIVENTNNPEAASTNTNTGSGTSRSLSNAPAGT